jgi:hypothetical protein
MNNRYSQCQKGYDKATAEFYDSIVDNHSKEIQTIHKEINSIKYMLLGFGLITIILNPMSYQAIKILLMII